MRKSLRPFFSFFGIFMSLFYHCKAYFLFFFCKLYSILKCRAWQPSVSLNENCHITTLKFSLMSKPFPKQKIYIFGIYFLHTCRIKSQVHMTLRRGCRALLKCKPKLCSYIKIDIQIIKWTRLFIKTFSYQWIQYTWIN